MGGSSHTTETALSGVQVQTSLLGQAIPIGWGRARISCNLVDYVGFQAIPKTTKSGGKGGSSTNTTYTYTASVVLALCEGPIQGVRSIYRDSSVFVDGSTTALAQAGLSVALGTLTQAPWGYLTSLFPTHAIGYSSLAYANAQDYALGSGASLSNHGFEIDFAIQMPGLPDADPKDIATDFLTNVSYGVTGWTSGLIGDWSNWSLYCRASNLLLSPVLDTPAAGADFLKRIAVASNSEFFWSEGLLKAAPYGDSAATSNGVTWTPNLTPVFDLDEDDFLDEVQLEIVDQTDAMNSVQIEFLDRSNQYQPGVQPAYDLDDVITFGLRKQDVQQMHEICDASIAQHAAQLWLQRSLYIRDLYTFSLPEDFVAVEPMDYLTLTTTVDGMKLVRQLVHVEQIDENADGTLQMVAWGIPGQTASAAAYAAHVSTGFQPAVEVAPGDVATPLIFNAPTSLSTQPNEVWCAVAGGANWGGANVWISVDNTTYGQVGVVSGPARYGVLTAALANHADPDTADTLSVDLSISTGVLGAATHAEADAGASLCLIDNELLAFADLAVTSANHFDLTYLRRGMRGSVPASHASSASFVRLDEGIFKFAYSSANVGATIYVKFQSFNIYGRGLQDIAGLTAYTVTLAPLVGFPGGITGLALVGGGTTWTAPSIDLICNPADGATAYRFDFYKADGTTFIRSIVSGGPSTSYTAVMALADGPQREYKIKAYGINTTGAGAASSVLDITNAAPTAVSSPAASGGATDASITCSAASGDFAGYVVFYSTTTGFDPAVTGSIVTSGIPIVPIYGLAAGTYYARIAAYDAWTLAPGLLNLSSEMGFTITTGGGASPTGSGGGGYGGIPDYFWF